MCEKCEAEGLSGDMLDNVKLRLPDGHTVTLAVNGAEIVVNGGLLTASVNIKDNGSLDVAIGIVGRGEMVGTLLAALVGRVAEASGTSPVAVAMGAAMQALQMKSETELVQEITEFVPGMQELRKAAGVEAAVRPTPRLGGGDVEA